MTRKRMVAGALVVVAAFLSTVVALTDPFSASADAWVAVCFVFMGALAAAALVRRHREAAVTDGEQRGERVGASWSELRAWTSAVALFVVVELTSYFAGFSGDRHDFPTLSSLYDEAAGSRGVKGLIVLAWLGLGWALFSR